MYKQVSDEIEIIDGNLFRSYIDIPDVRACALGQASSTILGKAIIGRSFSEIQKVFRELSNMLTENGPTPSKPFEDFYILKPASEYKNRHASILLALEATLDAFNQIQSDH